MLRHFDREENNRNRMETRLYGGISQCRHSNKANKILKWKPNLSFYESIKFTVNWYKFFYLNQKKIYNFSSNQIDEYNKKIK